MATLLLGDATAKSQTKSIITATINHHRYKVTGDAAVTTAGGNLVELVSVVTPHGLHGVSRTFGLDCTLTLATATLPAPATCGGYYTQTPLLKRHASKVWTTDTGLQATFDSFEGGWLRGTFQGMIEKPGPNNGGGPATATVKNGKFAVKVLIAG